MRHERLIVVLFLPLLFIPSAAGQKNAPSETEIDHFEIGRETFFDFGPPFNYYELFVVRPNGSGSKVQRIILTPPGDACLAPASIETASAALSDPVSSLLGNSSPCAIPEKELRRELKRCKHCMVFSGANVTLRVPCGASSRLIRSDILDRDMFSAAPNTPEHTSWTMQLLARLDRALGPGVMEKPVLSIEGEQKSAEANLDSETRERLESGAYDELLPKAGVKLANIYRASQVAPPSPSVQLLSISPFAPQNPLLPNYPPLAKVARVQGTVLFSVVVDEMGNPGIVTFWHGHKLLLEAVRQTVDGWKFPKEAAGQMISASIQFSLNCPPSQK